LKLANVLTKSKCLQLTDNVGGAPVSESHLINKNKRISTI
jgi:hypothetical protein